MGELSNRRILIIDDDPEIHADVRKVLLDASECSTVEDLEHVLFDEPDDQRPAAGAELGFEIDSAHQGQEGLELVRRAAREGRPYALVFLDVQMPPGWDGTETMRHLWTADPDLEIVFFSAHADYSWWESVDRSHPEKMLFLKKPFDRVEILQLALGLTRKWNLAREQRRSEAALAQVPRRMLEAQESERRRVSRELHDGVNQLLHSVKFRLRSIEEHLRDPARLDSVESELVRAQSLIDKSMEEIRRVSHSLLPTMLEDFGLQTAIAVLCEEFTERSAIEVDARFAGELAPMAGDVELALFRIVQESLRNVERHSGAARVVLELQGDGVDFAMEIRDDGGGFDPDAHSGDTDGSRSARMGLNNIRDRARLVGAAAEVRSAVGKGTTIRVSSAPPAPRSVEKIALES